MSPRPATLLLIAASAASGALLLYLGADLTFLLDDWEFLLQRREFSADSILSPHNEHISIIPVLVYRALVEVAGMDSALPFRVASTAVFLVSVALLFVWLRRRVGEWLALAGAISILFLGAAWEDLLWPFQIGYFGSMACGLGMLLSLEREDRRGDIAACALLTVSIAFSSLGLPFLVGAAVAIALAGPVRRRAFVVAIPAALFALWWLGWGSEAENSITAGNIATAPLFLLDGFASSISSLLGLATPRNEATIGALDWGLPLLAAGILLAGWRLWRLGHVPKWLLVVAATAFAFWLLGGFNEREGRAATASRYVYVGAIFCLMIAAELLHGVRLRPLALGITFGVLGVAVLSNVSYLHQSYESYRATSELIQADLAAVEIARDRIDPGLILEDDIAATGYVHVYALDYLAAADADGSPAYAPAELAAAPEPARNAADNVLAAGLGLTFTPEARPASPSGVPPAAVDGGPARVNGSCLSVPPTGPPRVLALPPGGAVLQAPPESGARARLRRFSQESFPVEAGQVAPGAAAAIDIPTDRSDQPWQLALDSTATAVVCGRGAA